MDSIRIQQSPVTQAGLVESKSAGHEAASPLQASHSAPLSASDHYIPSSQAGGSSPAVSAVAPTGANLSAVVNNVPLPGRGSRRKTEVEINVTGKLHTGDDEKQMMRPATGAAFVEGKAAIPLQEDFTLLVSGAAGYMNAKYGEAIQEAIHKAIGSSTDKSKDYSNPQEGLYLQGGLGLQWDSLGTQCTSPYVKLETQFGTLHNRVRAGAGIEGPLPWFLEGRFTIGGGATYQGVSTLNDKPVPFGLYAEAHIKGAPGTSLLGAVKSKWLFLGPVDLLPELTFYCQTPQYRVGDSRQILTDVTLLRVNLCDSAYLKLSSRNDVLGKTDCGESGSITLGVVASF